MGKTIRRKNYAVNGGIMMREKTEAPLPKEWHEARKKERSLCRKLRKIKKNN